MSAKKAYRLLLMNEWSGPSRHYEPKPHLPEPKVRERQVAFITALPVGEALARIRVYEDAMKQRYGHASAVYEFKLLAVTECGDLSASEVELTRADLVEALRQSAEDDEP